MSDARDRQDVAEALDADKIDDEEGEESLVLVDDDDNDVLTAGTGVGEQTAEEAALHVTDQP